MESFTGGADTGMNLDVPYFICFFSFFMFSFYSPLLASHLFTCMMVFDGYACFCPSVKACLLELDSSNSNSLVQSNPSADLWGDFSTPAR